MLTMILLGTAGVSVEKCSCTGKISLALPTENNCCPEEGDCMTLKSMQLSDYVPTITASLDMPEQPVLFPVIPPIIPTSEAATGANGFNWVTHGFFILTNFQIQNK